VKKWRVDKKLKTIADKSFLEQENESEPEGDAGEE